MGRHRAAWTLAIATAIVLLAAGAASAFQFKGCVSQGGAGPCANVGNASALNRPDAVVVSPDGRHVYVAAALGDAVSVFARDPSSGGLSFLSCVSDDGAGPCTAINHDRAVRGARTLVMSPDGRHLYVGAGFGDSVTDHAGDAISVFGRDANTGALSFLSCRTTNTDAEGKCEATQAGVLDDPVSLAISPDGDEVYVAGELQGSLGYFRRDGNTGQLGQFSCLGGAPECADVPHANALLRPSAVAVTRDGRFVYVAARDGDAIARFSFNNANGTLTYLGCVGASTAGGCSSIANASALDAPASLVVSPDGGHLFAAAQNGGAIGTFAINQTDGSLGFAGCDGSGQCTPFGNGNAANAPAAVAISPSGGRLYTAAGGGNAIGIFAPSVSADPLGFLGCISADGAGPCGNAGNGAAFNSPSALAVSPDGRHLYGTARNGHAIAWLGVSPPACSPVTTSTPFRIAVRVQLNCADPDGGDPLSFAVGGPANGTLSELSGNSVLFTPLQTFSGGQGIFDFSASDIDGAAGARATIDVGRRPRRLNQTIKTRFAFNRTHTWILRMQVLRVPGDAKVQVRCKKPKRLGKKACPFKRKSAKPKRHRATVDIKKKMFRKKQRKLRAGIRLQIRITAPGAIGKVVTYKLRPNKLPRSVERCLPPGASKPQKRC